MIHILIIRGKQKESMFIYLSIYTYVFSALPTSSCSAVVDVKYEKTSTKIKRLDTKAAGLLGFFMFWIF